MRWLVIASGVLMGLFWVIWALTGTPVPETTTIAVPFWEPPILPPLTRWTDLILMPTAITMIIAYAFALRDEEDKGRAVSSGVMITIFLTMYGGMLLGLNVVMEYLAWMTPVMGLATGLFFSVREGWRMSFDLAWMTSATSWIVLGLVHGFAAGGLEASIIAAIIWLGWGISHTFSYVMRKALVRCHLLVE